jgi:hypothetical protein
MRQRKLFLDTAARSIRCALSTSNGNSHGVTVWALLRMDCGAVTDQEDVDTPYFVQSEGENKSSNY